MKNINNKKTKRNPNFFPQFLIAVLTCILLVVIVQWDRGLFKAEFREGDIALRAIYAPYDLIIRGELNSTATELARKKAEDSVLPIYIFDDEVKAGVLKKAESIINSVTLLKGLELFEEDRIEKLKEVSSSNNISEALVINILESGKIESFSKRVKELIEEFMSLEVIAASDHELLRNSNITTIRVVDKDKTVDSLKFLEECFTLEDLKQRLKEKRDEPIVLDFINAILSVNLVYDKNQTQEQKRIAQEKIKSIYNIIEVKKNELILDKGERIVKGHILKLKGIEQNEPSAMKAGGIFGITILIGIFILLLGLYIKVYEPSLLDGNKELVLLALISVLILIVAKVIVMSPWPSTLIPVAVASMLIAVLINGRLAIVTTCFLSVLLGIVSGNRLDAAGLFLVGGIVGVFAMRGVRRRSQVIEAGLCVGLMNMSYLIVMGLMSNLDFSTYITESLFGLASGVIAALIVTGILPIFENLFKISTDISLLELADLNHPLLKEMVINAPGTYHHSLLVGNLAEAACEAIGANPLLARVSSYFHDVGKIEKAAYYSENQSSEHSAHDKLSPTMSSLIITNHVKNGVELAEKYKLNRKIVDIIKQHHGTGLVFYFFKRALEKTTNEEVGEQSFRYPGPKPQTREAACVLLADSVEAASRTLDDPTVSRIKGLVRKIINNKFIDGQLDECDLTLKDLEKIAVVFTNILTGIFHTRVEYPEEQEREK